LANDRPEHSLWSIFIHAVRLADNSY
jgi:hypothetical protein